MDFIRKPFRADVLLRRVGNILQTVEQIRGLKKAAVTDPMTGLLNKASAQEEIGLLCKEAPGVLMMIDLDSFKLVNDIYGHAMGDKVLIVFAEIIKSAVRSTDLVGRMGGDEFIAFCQHIHEEDVIAKKSEYINERLVEAARELMGEDMTIPLGASLGCVIAPDEGRDFQTLWKKADKALYNVKQNGKHGYAFFKEVPHEEEGGSSELADLDNAFKILNERNQAKGAFSLGYEHFRTVFRYLRRLTENYQKSIWALLFTINPKEGTEITVPTADAYEVLLDVLCRSLRQSDVVTQSGKNQFMVLLMQLQPMNLDQIVERIFSNWEEEAASKEYDLTYEMDTIR